MTWWRGAEGGSYGVFFNRDEKKTRTKGEPPKAIEMNGVDCIAPRDPDGGGTWILCNAFGVTIAVLNAYEAESRHKGTAASDVLSRGTIPHQLADVHDVASAVFRVHTLDAGRFRPFTVVLVDSANEASLQSDETGRIQELPTPITQPLISSSFAHEEVAVTRRSTFGGLLAGHQRIDREFLSAFHRYTGEAPSAFTPKMLRPDAQTFSLTELQIDPDQIRCNYESYPSEFVGNSEHCQCSIARQVKN